MRVLCVRTTKSAYKDYRITCVIKGGIYNVKSIIHVEKEGVCYKLLETEDSWHDSKSFVIIPSWVRRKEIKKLLLINQ